MGYTNGRFVRLEFLVHLLQPASIRVTLLYQIFSRVDEFLTLGISDVALLCEFSKEYLGDGGCEDNVLGVLLFCNLTDVLRILIDCQMESEPRHPLMLL